VEVLEMGLFSFIKSAGAKLGLVDAEPAAAENPALAAARNVQVSAGLAGVIASLQLPVEGLQVAFADGRATIGGTVPNNEAREKIVLAVGNHHGVGEVDDQLEVVAPEPPAVFHTVESGDTLSKIAREFYGVMRMYDVIFESNKPMLKHEDEIFPGQVLRVPPVEPPVHEVVRGETLGVVAKHWYGNAKRYTDIFEANRDKLHSPDVIEVGQRLVIPLIDAKV
jgi:nucleoid-associated protein YgaU